MDQNERLGCVVQQLMDYYGNPSWRTPLSPVDELVSTILSQNTNDANRDRAFKALKQRFPTWEAVCEAAEDEVIDTIRPAGLANQKGPRIQYILREISRMRGDLDLNFLAAIPQSDARDWLMQFKGVGPKTAAIVLQFSLGVPAFPVDTHIYRVTGRLGLLPPKMSVEQAHQHLAGLISPDLYYPLHLNLIRLGREICKARNPDCPACPVNSSCAYYEDFLSQS